MKRFKLFAIIALFLVLAATQFANLNFNSKPVHAQAESEEWITIRMIEEGANYYQIIASPSFSLVGQMYFVVNGIRIASNAEAEAEMMIERNDKAVEVYAEADYYDQNDQLQTIQSTCIVIRPRNVASEENSSDSQTPPAATPPAATTVLFGGVLPAILAIGSIILLSYLCFRKKIKPIDRVLNSLKSLDQNFNNAILIIKDEQLKLKKKERLYKNDLKNIYNIISKNINIVISLNIESLGQYNSLLTNLIKFENIIKALSISSLNKDDKYKIKYLNKINKITLPVIIANAEEVQKTCIISQNAKNSLFVQHTKSSQNLNNEDVCEKYLSKTLYLYDDEEVPNNGGEDAGSQD